MPLTSKEKQKIEIRLQTWATWHQRDTLLVKGFPRRSVGLKNGPRSEEFDDMVYKADVREAEAIESVLDDMSWRLRASVFHKYLHGTWPFPVEQFPAALESAQMTLVVSLRKKGMFF